MTQCKRCLQAFNKHDMIGANVFDATTGLHIMTRYFCKFCAGIVFGIEMQRVIEK